MIPSRLFRNTGIAPALRTLLYPSSSLPSSLRLRLATARAQSTATQEHSHPSAHDHAHAHAATSGETAYSQSEELRIEPRLRLTFTCTASGCGHRSTHQFSRHAYEKGLVLIECPGCKNRHLIADHIGWFKESTGDGKLKTIEDFMIARGERIRYGKIDTSGSIEYAPA